MDNISRFVQLPRIYEGRDCSCSSGSALGPGAGAAQPSASPLEGLLDPSYPRTQAALLKVAQMVTLLIAFICVRSSPWTKNYSAYSYFEVVTICDLIMILAFYLVHLFRFYRVLTCISWPLSELLHYLIGTLLLLIASIVAASKSYNQSGLVAGAIFGFMATFLCMASIWLSYKISCVTQSTDAAI
uniref:CKLF like MARVEL transmembrane domain containing 7 n=1 Tax=Rhinopithecus roxellana TaxID=61622 RepID=A0A2K6QYQ0_RHIRO